MTFDRDFYEGEDFSGLDELPEVIGRVRFVDCRFNGQTFIDTKLDGTSFERCSFDLARICGKIERCAFLNCSFRYANLLGADFVGCKMTGSNLGDVSHAGYVFSDGDWSYTELAHLRVKKHALGAANFTGASLFDCRFENCSLSGTRFDSTICRDVSLKGSDLRGADFRSMQLGGIDFKNCTADLDFAVMFTRAHGIRI